MATYNAKKLTIVKGSDTYIIDPMQGNETGYTTIPVTIAKNSWSGTPPYTYEWSNNHVTSNCKVMVSFMDGIRGGLVGDLWFTKATGKVTFVTDEPPVGEIPLSVTIIDGTVNGVFPIEADVVETDAVVGETTVQGALEDINDRVNSISIEKIDKEYITDPEWTAKTWTGLTSFGGDSIWTDGDNIYYSNASNQYVLDKATSTWSTKTWEGLTNFYGSYIWTDGDNIYCSNISNQYVLDKATSTWSTKTWEGLTIFNGNDVWSDGNNIYYSSSSTQYVLNKSTSTWSAKTWTGLTSFYGQHIWSDGDNIYYNGPGSNPGLVSYELNRSTSTWTAKTWTGLTNFRGNMIWSDGDNIYYSQGSDQYVLNKSTSTWSSKIWTELTGINGIKIWSDGNNIYYSNDSYQYIFDKLTNSPKLLIGTNGEFNAVSASEVIPAVINNLTSDSTTDALSAAQGKALNSKINQLIAPNAGSHNSIYRGINLGSAVTASQWAAIKAGTFDDLFIGDYWTINDVNWRIAAFDYWYNFGDTACTTHHVVIVPDSNLTSGGLNKTNITTGAYVGSDFYTGNNSNTMKSTMNTVINNAFGSGHILSHREALTNATTNGYQSVTAWYDSTAELMTEQMVYGGKVFGSRKAGANLPADNTIDHAQLPLFALDRVRICNRADWWLRDVVSEWYFALAVSDGVIAFNAASYGYGIRPAFGIYQA